MQVQEIVWRWIHRLDCLLHQIVFYQENLIKLAAFISLWVFPNASLCMPS